MPGDTVATLIGDGLDTIPSTIHSGVVFMDLSLIIIPIAIIRLMPMDRVISETTTVFLMVLGKNNATAVWPRIGEKKATEAVAAILVEAIEKQHSKLKKVKTRNNLVYVTMWGATSIL